VRGPARIAKDERASTLSPGARREGLAKGKGVDGGTGRYCGEYGGGQLNHVAIFEDFRRRPLDDFAPTGHELFS